MVTGTELSFLANDRIEIRKESIPTLQNVYYKLMLCKRAITALQPISHTL